MITIDELKAKLGGMKTSVDIGCFLPFYIPFLSRLHRA